MCDQQHLQLAATYAASRLALAKAKLPAETVAALKREAKLRSDLGAIHLRAAAKAVRAARAACAGKSGKAAASAASKAALASYRLASEGPVTAALSDAVEPLYRLALIDASKRATGQSRGPVSAPLVEKAAPERRVSSVVSFDTVDKNAVAALKRHQLFWAADHYGEALSARIASVAEAAIIRGGLGGDAAGTAMASGLMAEFGLSEEFGFPAGAFPGVPVPPRFRGRDREYFRALASNTATAVRVAGSVSAWERTEVTRFVVSNAGDERTCARCQAMDGKSFTVKAARKQLDKLLAAETPDDVRSAQPWLAESEFLAHVKAGDKALVGANVVLPPYHFECRCAVDVDTD